MSAIKSNQMCFSEASFSIFNWSKYHTTLLRKKDKLKNLQMKCKWQRVAEYYL